MANPENKQIPYESTQKDIRDAIESVATAIGGITHPDAEDIVYDNTTSGLSATDVQNAIDELSSEKADSSSLATVATSGDYDDLINKPTIPTVNDATLTIQKNGSDVATFTANASSNVTANVTVPTTTSELTNNSDFVSDASYVHTDNNFTTAEKTKLGGIESGAEVNVQSDWNEADNTKDDYIKNKPSSEVKSATDTFTTVNGGLLEECIINLAPVQSGSGDPSPDNVRPISGHTEVDLDVKDGDNVTQHLYQVQIGSTVYGGYVDLVSGVMTVDKGYVDLGNLNWSKGTYFASAGISSLCKRPDYSEVANAYCECFKVTSRENVDIHSEDDLISIQQDGQIVIYASQYADAPTFKTAVSGKKFVFELATPFTIQLTPQQIETLAGQNNLSTPLDGQSIDSVEYREVFAFDDVEKVVSLRVPISMLGTDESGRTTASQSYASGDYFYKDGYMCKALTSISAGAILTLNTNYSQGTLADILKAIENA